MKNLQQFIKEETKSIKQFEKWWIKMNKEKPEEFPLEFDEDNSGLWHEQYAGYKEVIEDEE